MEIAMKIRIGCGEWGFRELPMEKHFDICKSFGFKYMEIGIGGGVPGRLPEKMTSEDVAAFTSLRDQYGIKTPFCCLENDFTLPDADAHAKNLENCLEQMQMASKLGCTHIRLFAGFTPYAEITEVIWQRMFAAFEQAEALASSLGMLISIETHGKIDVIDNTAVHTHTVTTHRDGIKRLLAELPEKVGFNYDPGNIKAAAPDDKRYALDLLNARINYCHLKDWTHKGPGFIAGAPGDDDLDYSSLLSQIAFDGVYLIEYEPIEDIEDGIKRSLDYLKSFGELVF
jgi:sugar phosphate isomerase/epimerase